MSARQAEMRLPPPPKPRAKPAPIEPFDFAAAIEQDERAVPQPDKPMPAWLKLPGEDV